MNQSILIIQKIFIIPDLLQFSFQNIFQNIQFAQAREQNIAIKSVKDCCQQFDLKYYQNIKMEEQKISISILNRKYKLSRQEIINLKPIITPDILKDIQLPACLSKFSLKIHILTACLWFSFAIESSFTNQATIQLRENCLNSISSYYINSKMNFQLFQYGWMVSKLLDYPLDRCLHLIYFMIYGRLASGPFINLIIDQSEVRPKQRNILQLKTRFTRHFQSRRPTNLSQVCSQSETFAKELHKILKNEAEPAKPLKISDSKWNKQPLQKNSEHKRQWKNSMIPQKNGQNQQNVLKQRLQNQKKIVNIPLKAGLNQHSSIMISFKRQSNSKIGKRQVRRQKFNQWFDGIQKYDKSMAELEERQLFKKPEKKLNSTDEKSRTNNFNGFRLHKHPAQYFSGLTHDLRQKNSELDIVRSQCLTHTSHNMRASSSNFEHLRTVSSIFRTTAPNFATNLQKDEQISDKQMQEEKYDIIEPEEQNLNTGKKNVGSSSITRKNQHFCGEQKFMLFNRKMNNKNKILKYKQQYRYFLKSLLFDKLSKQY